MLCVAVPLESLQVQLHWACKPPRQNFRLQPSATSPPTLLSTITEECCHMGFYSEHTLLGRA
ncbi:unnamed protein product [Clavelina lepadiformis]|uniref:Uncharacterized protein n=1 Tax=Clavelina lepadiformis TaxID=159417 RepID=A0ABP0G079_CLALP